VTSRNPWLDIPEADYVGHMAGAAVGQRQALNAIFRATLARYAPARLLVLGCSTGNGFEHIDPQVTADVTGIDINAAYLDTVRAEHEGRGFRLHLECGDLAHHPLPAGRFDCVHAALVLEYLDWARLVPRVVPSLQPGGTLSVVLQVPSPTAPAVSRTAYSSLLRLENIFRFVDPIALRDVAAGEGLALDAGLTVPLPQGKKFEVLYFRR
jgi:SAM-dependent methyltransferase